MDFPAQVSGLLFCLDFSDEDGVNIKGVVTELKAVRLPAFLFVALVLDNGSGPRSPQPLVLRVTAPNGEEVLESARGEVGIDEIDVIGFRLDVGEMYRGTGTYLAELLSPRPGSRPLARRRLRIV